MEKVYSSKSEAILARDYIEQRLKEITNLEVKLDKKLSDFIFDTIMSKKFRKYSINPLANDKARNAIEINIKNNEPIKLAIPFGTYKLWRLGESPEPDWAELFVMIYYTYWLRPITCVYQPGVWFDFCGDDAILEMMNNIPEVDTEKYKLTFRSIIKFIQPYLPSNFKFTLSPVGERYSSKDEFLADLTGKIEDLEKKGVDPLTERQIEMMRFNIRPKDGVEIDFQKNHLIHDAYMNVSKRRPYHKALDKILVSATPFGDRTSLPVGTTKTSVVKFQTGAGVLIKRGDSFIESVHSPSQLEVCKFDWAEVSIDGLVGKNFKMIRVVSE
ncbi:MAG: hypothetical protein WC575_02210 [Patescibacteria group bacterium]